MRGRECVWGLPGLIPEAEALEILSQERLHSLPTQCPRAYLEGGRARLQARQRAAVHHACHSGVPHPHKVADQVGDLHQPVWAQHGDHLAGALGRRRVELGEHLQGGVLVLEGAAAAGALPPLLLVLVLILALPGRPAVGRRGGRGSGLLACLQPHKSLPPPCGLRAPPRLPWVGAGHMASPPPPNP